MRGGCPQRRRGRGRRLPALVPFGVDGAVDKHGAQCCRPGAARPAGDRSILDQRRRGYARRTWMRLWTTSGALAAAQCRRGLAASGCFFEQDFFHKLWKSRFRGPVHRPLLSTQEVDQGVDKLRAAGCRPRLAWPAGDWSNLDQRPAGTSARGFPQRRGISLWISSGWIARPRQPRAAQGIWRFSAQPGRWRLCTVEVNHSVDNLGAVRCRPRLARPAGC